MNTAVIINLDYESQPIVKCRQLWKMIDLRMAAAGFTRTSRRFVTAMDAPTACKQARGVMDSIEADYQARGLDAVSFIRDFYAVPCDQMINLAVPATDAIEVDLMASGAFQKFFT